MEGDGWSVGYRLLRSEVVRWCLSQLGSILVESIGDCLDWSVEDSIRMMTSIV